MRSDFAPVPRLQDRRRLPGGNALRDGWRLQARLHRRPQVRHRQRLLLGLLLWRLWVAYDRGISFLEPPRKTRTFDLSRYAADMFDDARETAEETNFDAL